jgi:cytoskeletal protein CcmA (bactofilin family)
VAFTIGKAITITGSLHAAEPLAINGLITGDVFVGEHDLTVEAEGRVEGTLTAREINVLGAVNGRLVATDVVRLGERSMVTADIAAPKTAIREGAVFKGRVEPARAEAAARVAAYRQGS